MEVSLVFPHQLYADHPAIKANSQVYILEDELYFTQFPFHKKKLVLHRASMKYFASKLQESNIAFTYIDHNDSLAPLSALFDHLAGKGVNSVVYVDTTDYLLERRLHRYAGRTGIRLIKLSSPNFISTVEDINDFFDGRKRYFMADFYMHQRKKFGIMVDGTQPWGGKWSFDEENRKKLPAHQKLPEISFPEANTFVAEAIAYVEANFPNNYGNTNDFHYPINAEEAEQFFQRFLKERFMEYGSYQDAIMDNESFLFHSIISSSLNIGLLNPLVVVHNAIAYAQKNQVPLNSLEGFVRQILGWREYIRAVYVREGVKQRTKNFFNFDKKIPESFWNATTTIAPVDSVIRRLEDTAYSHHIERLMVMANFFLLAEFSPDEVYKWFMTWYIDAYDWVMVPNVYGMSQFADGGLMSTKPYISSSNYVLKMSDFRKAPWCKIWDGLFWRFMSVHRDLFEKNTRLSFLLRSWDRMSADKRAAHLAVAKAYLDNEAKPVQAELDL